MAARILVETRPRPPRMIRERIDAVTRQELQQLSPLLFREARTDPHMLQRSRLIKEPEQKRSNGSVIAVLVPPKPRDDAIAIALMLHLDHRALVRFVDAGLRLDDQSIEACTLEAPKPILRNAPLACRWSQVDRRRGVGEQFLQPLPSPLKRFAAQIPFALRKQIEEHD